MVYYNEISEKKFRILFGEKVKLLRVNQEITQSQLAFECNTVRNQIGRIERGEINTSIKTVLELSKALNVHPKELFNF